MDRIYIDDFGIKLNKEKILAALGCNENSSVYGAVSRYFREEEDTFRSLVSPKAAAKREGMRIFCLLTLGREISEYSKRLFDAGEGMKGLLINAMADEYLFEMDAVLSERIKTECAKTEHGVKERLCAPENLPLPEQKVIVEKTEIDGVGLTEAFMLNPVKTLGYILELTEDTSVFNAQHDCSKCRATDCPRRSAARGNFEILSRYAYTPRITEEGGAVCIDIGTTTVAFELITKEGTLKTYKTVNPQRRFGSDVLSRIEAANRGRGDEMTQLIRYTAAKGFREVTEDYRDTKKVVIAGNTTMIYLLMGYSCASLGSYPFKAEHTGMIRSTLSSVTRSSLPDIETVIFGGISAFVGGDAVSGLYMCDFDKSDKINMFIDLGTNGEMAIGNKEKILVTSVAAGPAFEGGLISCGTGSVGGAVCGVDLKTGTLKTIDDKPPSGICGTGIIELISELLENGIMDETGLLIKEHFSGGYRLCGDIVFTQQDIRQVQMAKAAVRAGIEILMRQYGAGYRDIGTVYLAGGFGCGLSVKKACRAGILPAELEAKTRVAGNSSLGGCAKLCSQTDGSERVRHIKDVSEEITLAENEEFNKLYIEYMDFKSGV